MGGSQIHPLRSRSARNSRRLPRAPARRRFTRKLPEDRRAALVDATIASLKRNGHDGLVVRKIAAAAHVSIGLINHHFPRKDALVAEAYRRFHRQLLDGFQSAVAGAPDEPRARLRAFFEANFTPPNLDRDVLTAWLVFWSLFRHSRPIQRAHRDTYGGYLELVRRLLADVRAGASDASGDSGTSDDGGRHTPRLAAIGLTALLDGLWLEWCLDPDNFSPREAIELCESWAERLR